LERIGEVYGGNLSEISSVLNDISYGRSANLTRNYRGSFQQIQSAVNSVSRGYERLADDLKRASAHPAPKVLGTTAARPAINTPPRPTPAPAAHRPANNAHLHRSSAPDSAPVPTPKPQQIGGGVSAPPLPVAAGRVTVPSGAHEYNRKDFGKYK